MGKYQNGEDTKKLIIKVCRDLFYEKGYNNTTYDDIGKEACVNRALICYHCKTKKEIAKEILFDMIGINKTEASSYTQSPTLQLVLSDYFKWYKFLNDEKYRRFCNDSTFSFYTEAENKYGFYSDSYELYNMFINRYPFFLDKVNYESFCAEYLLETKLGSELDIVFEKYLTEEPEVYGFREISEKKYRIFGKILNVPKENIDSVIDEINKILDIVDYESLDTTLGSRI